MGVLDKARSPGLKDTSADVSMIPAGATSVVARGSSKGWALVFETPSGEVEVVVGDMQRAVRLALRLQGTIERQKRKHMPKSS